MMCGRSWCDTARRPRTLSAPWTRTSRSSADRAGAASGDEPGAGPGPEPVGVVAPSPLLRAQQTAAPLAVGRPLPVRTLDGLREIDAGELAMQSSLAAIKQYLGVAFAWASGALDARVPGARSGREVLAAIDAAVREVEVAASAVMAVGHGAVTRAWLAARAVNVGAEYVRTHPQANTGVVTLDGDGVGSWRVLSWHDRSGAEQPVAACRTLAASPRSPSCCQTAPEAAPPGVWTSGHPTDFPNKAPVAELRARRADREETRGRSSR
ncbi:histidine phosphatase family protein [Geodermatophilus nigrescens]